MEKSQDDMVRKRTYLSAEEKYHIFLEAAMAKAKGSFLKKAIQIEILMMAIGTSPRVAER